MNLMKESPISLNTQHPFWPSFHKDRTAGGEVGGGGGTMKGSHLILFVDVSD